MFTRILAAAFATLLLAGCQTAQQADPEPGQIPATSTVSGAPAT